MPQGITLDMDIVKMCKCKKATFFISYLTIFSRNRLMDAYRVAQGAPRGVCAEGGQSVSDQGEETLLMVEWQDPLSGCKETVLRSIDEVQPGGTFNIVIPYRENCACEVLRYFYGLSPSLVSIPQIKMAQWPKSTFEPNVY